MIGNLPGRSRFVIRLVCLLLVLLSCSSYSPILSYQGSPTVRKWRSVTTGRGSLTRSSFLSSTRDEAADIPDDGVIAESTPGDDSSSSNGDTVKWSQVRAWESDTFNWSVVQEREAEINRLKFQLADANSAIEDGERRAEEAEQRLEEVEKESEVERGVEKGLVAQIKAQFEKEREQLSEQLRSFSQKLSQTKEEADDRLATFKSEASERENRLESKVTVLESSLQKAQDREARTKREFEEEKSGLSAILRREKEDAEKMVKSNLDVAFQEKRVLEKEIWYLEPKLDKAKLELVNARKEVENAKAIRAVLEEELKEKESHMQERLEELEQRIEADEMFRVRSKIGAREKLRSVAVKFQRKLEERETLFDDTLQSVRDEAERRERDLEKTARRDRISLYMEKHAAVAESRAALEDKIRDTEQKLAALMEESNAKKKQMELIADQRVKSAEDAIKSRLSETEAKLAQLMKESSAQMQLPKENADRTVELDEQSVKQKLSESEAHLALLKEEYESRIQESIHDAEEKIIAIELSLNKKLLEAKEETNRMRSDLLREKEEALLKQTKENQAKLLQMQMSLSGQIKRAKAELMQLKIDKEKMSAEFGSERGSFRKLATLTYTLAKERTVSARRRLFKRKKG